MPTATKSRLQHYFPASTSARADLPADHPPGGLILLKIFQDFQNVHTFGWVGHAANPVYVGPA
jgi:hypothetical protein